MAGARDVTWESDLAHWNYRKWAEDEAEVAEGLARAVTRTSRLVLTWCTRGRPVLSISAVHRPGGNRVVQKPGGLGTPH